jgi:hypothetical protein
MRETTNTHNEEENYELRKTLEEEWRIACD